jgi:hypothetical protein
MWQTMNPLEGEVFFEKVLGVQVLEDIREKALQYIKPDLEGTIEWLKKLTLELQNG